MSDRTKQGLSAEERARELEDYGREQHEADSTPFVGCAGFPYMTDAITAALTAHARDARKAALEEAAQKMADLAWEVRKEARVFAVTERAYDAKHWRADGMQEGADALRALAAKEGGEG